MKHDYFENDGADEKRTKRKKKKSSRKALKGFLIFVALVVVALAVFVTTVKVLAPDFDFKSIVPKTAYTFFDERILGNTTTTEPTQTTTTKPTTTEAPTEKFLDYLESAEFKMNSDKAGNSMGNLLNGGKVGTDNVNIYHLTKDGIYRLNAESESFSRVYSTSHKLSSLNLRGDYLYFVDEDENVLYKLQKGKSKPESVAQNATFAYVYDNTVYFTTVSNEIRTMGVKNHDSEVVYSAGANEIRLVGISTKRIFFAEKYSTQKVNYLSVELDGEGAPAPFFESDGGDSKLVMENGFMYYYNVLSNNKCEVIRRKFGSDKTVTLAKDSDGSNYIAVNNNRLYYPEFENGKFHLTEVNMNSGSSRYLMTVDGASADHQLKIFHSYDYDFVIGKVAKDGKKVYRAGCVYTGSTNYMRFSDGAWKY